MMFWSILYCEEKCVADICFSQYFCNKLQAPLYVLFPDASLCFTESAARDTLEQVMADALTKAASTRSAVQAVCLSVAGVNHPTDQDRILNWLRFASQRFPAIHT